MPTLCQYYLLFIFQEQVKLNPYNMPQVPEALASDLTILAFIEGLIYKHLIRDEKGYLSVNASPPHPPLLDYQLWLNELITLSMPKSIRQWIETFYIQPSHLKSNTLFEKLVASLLSSDLLMLKKESTLWSELHMDTPRKKYQLNEHWVKLYIQNCADFLSESNAPAHCNLSPDHKHQSIKALDIILYYNLEKQGLLDPLLSEYQLNCGKKIIAFYQNCQVYPLFNLMCLLETNINYLFDTQVFN